jgi:hypothetical protein
LCDFLMKPELWAPTSTATHVLPPRGTQGPGLALGFLAQDQTKVYAVV